MTMILPALFGAGAAAGSATAGLGSGLLSVSGLLSGVATVGGVLAQIAAGNAQAESYKAQAFASKMEAGNEEIQGVQRQGRMKRELMRILGESDVNYAAAGIDLSGGVAKEARDTAETRATQEINIDRQMTESKRQMLLAQAATYRRMAKQAKQTGFLNAFATAASGVGGMVG
jgi:hypothetical protein